MPENNPNPGATPIVEVGTSELEVELEAPAAAAAATAVTTTTAVTTADVPTRGELVPVYLLAMHLPSPDILADDYTDYLNNGVRRVKEWQGARRDKARIIENMRRSIYRRIERLWCMVREFGVWIAVTEQGVMEAERISKEVRETLHRIGLGELASRYFVRAIRVYLEASDAKFLLDAAVAQLSKEVEELERRIKDAEATHNKRLVKELIYKREYVKHLLATFRKYIENINS